MSDERVRHVHAEGSDWPEYVVRLWLNDDVWWQSRHPDRPGFVNFAIYEVEAIGDDGVPLLSHRDAISSGHFAHTIQEAHADATGSVKWDGCVNWISSTDVMVHHCYSSGGPRYFGEALNLAYEMACEWMNVAEALA